MNRFTLRGGVVGYQLPSLRSSTLQSLGVTLLIFSTDGIRSGFEKEVNLEDPPQRIADMIIMNSTGRRTMPGSCRALYR